MNAVSTVKSQSDALMPYFYGPYQMKIKVISATLDRSTDMMGKMDPYCVIEHSRQIVESGQQASQVMKKVKGPTHKGGHKAPVWNWESDFVYGGETTISRAVEKDLIKFIVFEEDLTSSDLVGETAITDVHDLVMLGSSSKTATAKKELQLRYNQNPVGKITVEITLTDQSPVQRQDKFIPGTLTVQVQSALITKESDVFSKMDPFITLQLGSQKLQKTKTKQSAGLTPEWNENFKYTINSIEDFKQSFVLTLKEEDLYEHDTMGDITLPLGLLYIGLKDQAIKIYDKTSLLCVGHIVITTSFDPIKQQPPVTKKEEKKVEQPIPKKEEKKIEQPIIKTEEQKVVAPTYIVPLKVEELQKPAQEVKKTDEVKHVIQSETVKKQEPIKQNISIEVIKEKEPKPNAIQPTTKQAINYPVKGKLELTIKDAKLLKDKDGWNEMSPYVLIDFKNLTTPLTAVQLSSHLGAQRTSSKSPARNSLQLNQIQTQVHTNGGQKPLWNEKFTCTVSYENQKLACEAGMIFKVYDDDKLNTQPVLVGESKFLSISEIISNKEISIPLMIQSQDAGTLNIETVFTQDTSTTTVQQAEKKTVPYIPTIKLQDKIATQLKLKIKQKKEDQTIINVSQLQPEKEPESDKEPEKPTHMIKPLAIPPLNINQSKAQEVKLIKPLPTQQLQEINNNKLNLESTSAIAASGFLLNNDPSTLQVSTKRDYQFRQSPLPSLRKIGLKKKTSPRYKSTKPRPPWNERFFLDGVTNYTEAHPYFKQYFDKPNKKTPYTRFRQMNLDQTSSIKKFDSIMREGDSYRQHYNQSMIDYLHNEDLNGFMNNNTSSKIHGKKHLDNKQPSQRSVSNFNSINDLSLLPQNREQVNHTEMKFFPKMMFKYTNNITSTRSISKKKVVKKDVHHQEHADYLYERYLKRGDGMRQASGFIEGGVSQNLNKTPILSTNHSPVVGKLPRLKLAPESSSMRQIEDLYGQSLSSTLGVSRVKDLSNIPESARKKKVRLLEQAMMMKKKNSNAQQQMSYRKWVAE